MQNILYVCLTGKAFLKDTATLKFTFLFSFFFPFKINYFILQSTGGTRDSWFSNSSEAPCHICIPWFSCRSGLTCSEILYNKSCTWDLHIWKPCWSHFHFISLIDSRSFLLFNISIVQLGLHIFTLEAS